MRKIEKGEGRMGWFWVIPSFGIYSKQRVPLEEKVAKELGALGYSPKENERRIEVYMIDRGLWGKLW